MANHLHLAFVPDGGTEDLRCPFGRKVEYLRELSHAALMGRLDGAHIRTLSEGEALKYVERLLGLGPFSARLVVLRGAGRVDGTPAPEPRFLRALQVAYGLEEQADTETIGRISGAWRPFRTWVIVLLRVMLDDSDAEGRRKR